MQRAELRQVEKELGTFVEDFAPELGRAERRYWCKLYLTGLLLDGERKSIEPLAQRVPGGNEQALQQFVNQSPWAHEPVQDKLSRQLVRRSGQGKGVLVLDDTTLPKKGEASVGVARQYCGALGKVTNCSGDRHLALLWTASPFPAAGGSIFTTGVDYGLRQVRPRGRARRQARVSREMEAGVRVA